ncbi:hypothetical protein JOC76_000771 [Neobacillus cucumis]|nr:hypothetical protein [Neobacillus cucumis]
MQNVIPTNGEVKFSGAAVITGKTKKLLGFLNEEEMEGLTWISGKGKGGLVKSFDAATNQPIIYEVKTMKSKITLMLMGTTSLLIYKSNQKDAFLKIGWFRGKLLKINF